MSTIGAFNRKNPTIRRILKEANELATSPSADYHAEPLESNLFEWHFTLRGPPAPSPYAGGIYHGRIVLPPTYPLRPPSFRFLTPTGRFEVNREICLSISGHHEETWQPAWGLRTALVAIRSFMDTDAKGQLGGLECDDRERRRMAVQSGGSTCAGCGGRSNSDIMSAREDAVRQMGREGGEVEEKVPEELRLAFRDELGKGGESAVEGSGGVADGAPQNGSASSRAAPSTGSQVPVSPSSTVPVQHQRAPVPTPQLQQPASPAWIDKAIMAVIALLAILIMRRIS